MLKTRGHFRQFSSDTVIVLKVVDISPKALKHHFKMSRTSKQEVYKNLYTVQQTKSPNLQVV